MDVTHDLIQEDDNLYKIFAKLRLATNDWKISAM